MKEEIEFGKDLLRQKQFDMADAHFEELITRYPGQVEPIRLLIQVARLRGDRPAVRARLERLLTLEPDALFERALYALLRGWNDIDTTRDELAILLELARAQKLTAHQTVPLIRVIQYAATGRRRIEYLVQVKSMLADSILQSTNAALAEKILLAEVSLALEDYDDVIAVAEELRGVIDQKGLKDRIRAISRVAEKIRSPDFPDFNAEKVFGIGLSRTGTSSLNAALQRLGYHAIHWLNPMTRDLIHQDDFILFDAFTDISVSHQFEWLYYSYPNSKFILTNRAVESWSRSIERHYENLHGIGDPNTLTQASAKKRFRTRGGQMDSNLYAQHHNWPNAYATFHERVYSFFKNKPADRFLEMAIVEGEGWETLCPFLGKPVPDVEFPNLNSGRGKRQDSRDG